MKPFFSPGFWCIVVFIIWITTNLAWLLLDQRTPCFDSAEHAYTALHYTDAIRFSRYSDIPEIIRASRYPPLTQFVCSPFALFHRSADALIFGINLIFGGLITVSFWRLARELHAPWVGPGALAVFFFQTVITAISREFMLDFSLTAMVICAYWQIIRYERTCDCRNGIVLGLILGLGMLTKWTFHLYVIPVAGWLVFRCWNRSPRAEIRRNLGLVALTAFVSSGWFYIFNFKLLLRSLHRVAVLDPPQVGIPAVEWSWENINFYFYSYVLQSGVITVFAALVLGILLFIRGSAMARCTVLWTAGCYVLLTLMPAKNLRFFIPVIPLIAFSTWWGVTMLRRRSLKTFLGGLIICVSILQLVISMNSRIYDTVQSWNVSLGGVHASAFAQPIDTIPEPRVINTIPGPRTPTQSKRLAAQTVRFFKAQLDVMERDNIKVLALTSAAYVSTPAIAYEIIKQELIGKIDVYPTGWVDMGDELDEGILRSFMLDFIVYTHPPTISDFDRENEITDILAKELLFAEGKYRLVYQKAVRKGETLGVYKRMEEL